MILLCFYGPTGSGKSTAAGLACQYCAGRGLSAVRLKLAEPLYELQDAFYRTAGRPVERYAQDQVLLETIAAHLRRIRPDSLAAHFLGRLDRLQGADVVVNDDLRDVEVDYPALRGRGFRFVRVRCSEDVRLRRLGRRADLTASPNSKSESALDRIAADFTIDNDGDDPAPLAEAVSAVCRGLLP